MHHIIIHRSFILIYNLALNNFDLRASHAKIQSINIYSKRKRGGGGGREEEERRKNKLHSLS